MHNHTEFSI